MFSPHGLRISADFAELTTSLDEGQGVFKFDHITVSENELPMSCGRLEDLFPSQTNSDREVLLTRLKGYKKTANIDCFDYSHFISFDLNHGEFVIVETRQTPICFPNGIVFIALNSIRGIPLTNGRLSVSSQILQSASPHYHLTHLSSDNNFDEEFRRINRIRSNASLTKELALKFVNCSFVYLDSITDADINLHRDVNPGKGVVFLLRKAPAIEPSLYIGQGYVVI